MHIQAVVRADGILLGISFKLQLLVINLASVSGRQLINSPTDTKPRTLAEIFDTQNSFIKLIMTNFVRPKIDKIYIGVFAITVFFSWTLHELAHWTIGKCLGYEMGMTLNSAFPINGNFSRDLHYQIISAAGPIFTLSQAAIFYALMKNKNRVLLYPILFTCFYTRLFATIISFRHPNDEARISTAIGIGKFTLPLIVTGFLFILIYRTTKDYKFDLKFNLANLGLTVLFSSIIILVDMYLKIRLL